MPLALGPAPPRIEVDVDVPAAQTTDYRSAIEAPVLRLRWWGFTWFNLTMSLVSLPIVGMLGALLAVVGLWILAWIPVALVLYVALAVTVNEVRVIATKDEIRSSSGPLPLGRTVHVPLQGVPAIFATASLRLENGWAESTNVAWYVAARRGEHDVPITRLLRKREEAIFVARALEQATGIGPSDELDDPSA